MLFTTINGMEQNAQFGYALGELGDIDDNGLEGILILHNVTYILYESHKFCFIFHV